MLDATSAAAVNQREYDFPVLKIGKATEAAEATVAAPTYSITWGSKCQWLECRAVGKDGKVKYRPNIDWLEGNILGEFEDQNGWQKQLDQLRLTSEALETKTGKRTPVPVQFCGLECQYHRGPTGLGSVTFDHILSAFDGSVCFCFADVRRVEESKENAAASFQFKGQFLMGKKPSQALEDVNRLISAIGFKSFPDIRISMVHFALDVLGVSLSEVKEWELADLIACQGKAGKDDFADRTNQTFSGMLFGQKHADVWLQVYDKWLELKEGGDLMKARRYRQLFPDMSSDLPLTRFEWKVKTGALKQDRFNMRDGRLLPFMFMHGMQYLMTKWFRPLLAGSRAEKKKMKTLPWWDDIQEELPSWAVAERGDIPDLEKQRIDADVLFRQMKGCLVTASLDAAYGSIEEALLQFNREVVRELGRLQDKRLLRKVELFGKKEAA